MRYEKLFSKCDAVEKEICMTRGDKVNRMLDFPTTAQLVTQETGQLAATLAHPQDRRYPQAPFHLLSQDQNFLIARK